MPRKIEWCLVGVQLPWWTRAKTNGVIGWPALRALLPSTVSVNRCALIHLEVASLQAQLSTTEADRSDSVRVGLHGSEDNS